MAVAYIAITTEVDGEKEVKNHLSAIPEIKEIHEVHGVYDLIVRMETDKMSELKDTIGQKIICLDQVRSTLTLLVT